MSSHDSTWESDLLEQFSCMSASRDVSWSEAEPLCSAPGLLSLSDEVLLEILRYLEPVSLLRLGGTCSTMFRVSNCNLLWTQHFQVNFINVIKV